MNTPGFATIDGDKLSLDGEIRTDAKRVGPFLVHRGFSCLGDKWVITTPIGANINGGYRLRKVALAVAAKIADATVETDWTSVHSLDAGLRDVIRPLLSGVPA